MGESAAVSVSLKPAGPLVASAFEVYVEQARRRLPGVAQVLVERVTAILKRRHEVMTHRRPFRGMDRELTALVPPRFLDGIPFERLAHVPRYLQALMVRAERAAVHPVRDKEKWGQVEPFARAVSDGLARSASMSEAWEEVRWMVEEYKVSCFAQELGTAVPVSAKRLGLALEKARAVGVGS